MVHSDASWYLGNGYTIYRMYDSGSYWYELNKDGEFIGNYDTYNQAKEDAN